MQSPNNYLYSRQACGVASTASKALLNIKEITVMYTNCQPTTTGTVHDVNRMKAEDIPCPEAIINYNRFMDRVDRGDQCCVTIHAEQRVESFKSTFSSSCMMYSASSL